MAGREPLIPGDKVQLGLENLGPGEGGFFDLGRAVGATEKTGHENETEKDCTEKQEVPIENTEGRVLIFLLNKL